MKQGPSPRVPRGIVFWSVIVLTSNTHGTKTPSYLFLFKTFQKVWKVPRHNNAKRLISLQFDGIPACSHNAKLAQWMMTCGRSRLSETFFYTKPSVLWFIRFGSVRRFGCLGSMSAEPGDRNRLANETIKKKRQRLTSCCLLFFILHRRKREWGGGYVHRQHQAWTSMCMCIGNEQKREKDEKREGGKTGWKHLRWRWRILFFAHSSRKKREKGRRIRRGYSCVGKRWVEKRTRILKWRRRKERIYECSRESSRDEGVGKGIDKWLYSSPERVQFKLQ